CVLVVLTARVTIGTRVLASSF
ncbi:MAG: hypothetical protein QOH85_1094, partial [Acidobacteriaceae bacterium]|nr:hypothetical protein [Acidobacteriaceae bacterium]